MLLRNPCMLHWRSAGVTTAKDAGDNDKYSKGEDNDVADAHSPSDDDASVGKRSASIEKWIIFEVKWDDIDFPTQSEVMRPRLRQTWDYNVRSKAGKREKGRKELELAVVEREQEDVQQ